MRARAAHSLLRWAYLAAACAIALYMWEFGDRWWPATFLLFMGRWVFLLPLALLGPAALLLRPRRRRPLRFLPLVFGALIVLGPLMGGRLGWRRLLPPPGGMPLRIVTFNSGGGETIAPDLLHLLAAWNADVVLLQECGERLAAESERMPGWRWHHAAGLCLLTQLPIDAAEQMDRASLQQLKQVNGLGIGGAGYVIRYSLRTQRGAITVTNLHLETPRKGFEGLMTGDFERLRENTELRDLESRLARRWAGARRGPSIVAGDFNTPVESRIFREHWGDLDDAFSRVGFGFGITKYNGWIRIRIDHVLTDEAWRAVRIQTWRDVGSDHRPLIADLILVAR